MHLLMARKQLVGSAGALYALRFSFLDGVAFYTYNPANILTNRDQ